MNGYDGGHDAENEGHDAEDIVRPTYVYTGPKFLADAKLRFGE